MNRKSISHFIWIILSVTIGVGFSYFFLKGGADAYRVLADKEQPVDKPELVVLETPDTLEETTGGLEVVSPVVEAHKTISIGFVGDIVPGLNATPSIFSDVVPYTEKPDIMIGNLEGAVSQNEHLKCGVNSTNCFSFNGNGGFLNLLREASFDVLNIANNHFNDYGKMGQEETLEEIQKAGIIASGMKDEVAYVNKNSLTVGIVGFSTYEWTTNMNNKNKLEELINTADQHADIVVVIFHGGAEGVKYSSTPNEKEWYLNEDRGNVRSFAHSAIDAGADIVLGSGPHVLRGMEVYNHKLIAYSLGNFASADMTLRTSGILKTSAMLEATLNEDGTLARGTVFPFEIDKYGVPHPDILGNSISTINNLSRTDFGDQGVSLTSMGEIILR